MQPYILQDWTTIRSAQATVTQGEGGWLDLAPHQDVQFYVDVREQSGASAPNIFLQTSPNKEDVLFQTMVTVASNSVANPYVVKLSATPTVPLARYVRWQLSMISGGTWDVTFRVLVGANTLVT